MIVDTGVGHETPELVAELFDLIENRATAMAESTMAVDPSIYSDPEQFALERERIFAFAPVLAAHGKELPNPRDFVVTQLVNNEAILVRQEDGSVRAFVNACRHRGARLVEEDTGSARLFSCRYHGWSFDTDGDLRSVANSATFGEVDKDCSGLIELPCEERHGVVWVVDKPGATIDVAAWLGPEIDESLSFYNLDDYVIFRVGRFDEPINWKALMDAFVDAYHIASTHAKSVAEYFYNNIQIWEPMGRHGRSTTPRKSIDKIRDLEPGSVPLSKHVTIAHFLMPNTTMLRQPDHFEMLNFMPHPTDPGRSRAEIRILVHKDSISPEMTERWEKNWKIIEEVLRAEDLVLNRDLQKAVSNRDTGPLILGRNEIANQHFHTWLRRALDTGEL